ncbi:diacylglycerol kinase family protein [Pseudoflavitalea sp. G-6-1-2]|uniref:diacylglycerol kinase family protein n=1 Tax=Pseudoflavitalea sp. G-6-1-2 TaxID=2728841 RepID=UPI00146B6EC9|nr:diacylglycerol kinase family protein [Pseudoflavitalea sp. G-6-1-2]NML23168.1 diacylglycerol kinase family protein [Pseudoflavitalea sp. G-6-1-2]
MSNQQFSIAARLRSFGYAISGLRALLQKEHNSWLHLVASLAAIGAGMFFQVSRTEWIALVFCIGIVWMAELFNTCIERTMDFISKERLPQIKVIKDLGAAAVLVAAITALVAGAIIFIPKILAIL